MKRWEKIPGTGLEVEREVPDFKSWGAAIAQSQRIAQWESYVLSARVSQYEAMKASVQRVPNLLEGIGLQNIFNGTL